MVVAQPNYIISSNEYPDIVPMSPVNPIWHVALIPKKDFVPLLIRRVTILKIYVEPVLLLPTPHHHHNHHHHHHHHHHHPSTTVFKIPPINVQRSLPFQMLPLQNMGQCGLHQFPLFKVKFWPAVLSRQEFMGRHYPIIPVGFTETVRHLEI